MKFDLTYCLNRTSMNRSRLALFEKVLNDADRKARLQSHECRLCFYIPSVGGSAITESECQLCHTSLSFESTAVDILCTDCAKEKGLCKHCGADINEKLRRKL